MPVCSQACTLPTSPAASLQARPTVLLKLPFRGVYELVVLWPYRTFLCCCFFMLYLFSLCNLGWGITGLVSDVDIKTIARMNECQGTELEVHFLVENFLYIFYLCIFIISLASEPTIRLIRGTGLPFVNCCSYLISASILSSLELTPCCG